jgi:hypothetical protein
MKMSKVLATMRSNSNPGKAYEIILGDDNVIYCTCWAWKRNRTCKHLDMYMRSAKDKMIPTIEDNLEAEIQKVADELLRMDVP